MRGYRHSFAFAVGCVLAVVAGCSQPPAGQRAETAAQTPSLEELELPPQRAGVVRDAAGQSSRTPADLLAGSGGSVEAFSIRGSRIERWRTAGQPRRSSEGDAVPGAAPGEEIWFIAVPDEDDAPLDQNELGTGSLVATSSTPLSNGETTVPLPLEHTDVRATIRGYVATVDVTQQFRNPYDEKIEAVYTFPLPENAAVREFVMTIGDRTIRGILREKEQAEQLYAEARAQGYRASLLTQRRPNVFEQKVANIEPGRGIDVSLRYFHTLPYSDGWYSFVFPTVVGPRYNPPGSDDPIAALPRDAYAEPAAGSAVRYLRPDERSAHDIGIAIDLDAGVVIESLEASHPVDTAHGGGSTAKVALAGEGMIPNRDFVLRFKVAGDTVKSNMLTYVDPDTGDGYFTMMLYPPAVVRAEQRRPVEMVFVLDTSGSMSGRPLEQAKEAVLTALERLGPDDTFQIIRFSSDASALGADPVPATADNVRRARRYVERLDGSGGTRMLEGIRAALGFAHDERRLRFVTFMTDGFIGNETEIIGEVHRLIGSSRIFSFGVGTSVNRYLLERLASEGRGAVAYLGVDESAERIMSFFFERISHPAVTDLEIDFKAMHATDVYPSRLPDLFVGRPVVVTGKFRGEPAGVTVRGRAGDRSVDFAIPPGTGSAEQSFVASLWARLRIADLADRQAWTPDPYGELAREIRDTALVHGLMSRYTAFVAVDASEQTAGTHGTTIHQAVPVPDGVRYDTTVDDR